jgi:hypothetical protein
MSRRKGVRVLVSGCALLILGAFLASCDVSRPPAPTAQPNIVANVVAANGTRPECPQGGQWARFFKQKYNAAAIFSADYEIALSRPVTDIVEFHDCQQFITTEAGKARYISLFAIFARARLDTAYTPPPKSGVFDPKKMGVPMATIYSYDSSYAPLFVKPGFNCLYFFRTNTGVPVTWAAQMVSVGNRQADCALPLAQPRADLPMLPVNRLVQPNAPPSDYPPVAKWDWDPLNARHYIGIRCEDAWCEVLPQLAVGARFASSKEVVTTRPLVKGWYDQQILTVAAPGTPQVSTIVGTFIPDPRLGEDNDLPETSRFANAWTNVATVGIEGKPGGYTSKLNFVENVSGKPQNTVALCFATGAPGSPNACFPNVASVPQCATDGRWYARVTSGSGTSTMVKHFCVTRRAHEMPGMPRMPGVVRWRWMLDDETMWVRCVRGCCEVSPPM